MFSNFLRLLAFVPIFALVGCSSSTQSIIDSIYFSSGHGDFLREGFCGIYHAHWDLSSDDEFVSKIKAEKKRCFANLSNSCDSENMRDCAAFGYLLWDEYDEFDKYEELLKNLVMENMAVRAVYWHFLTMTWNYASKAVNMAIL